MIPKASSANRLSLVMVACALTLAISACDFAVTPEERLQRAETAIADGDLAVASVELRALLQKAPDNGAARLLLGQVYADLEDAASAAKELQRAIELGQNSDQTLLLQAQMQVAIGEFTNARATVEQISVLSPSTQLVLGEIALGEGKLNEAAEVFADLSESNLRAQALFGQALVEIRRSESSSERALDFVARSLEVDNSQADAWLLKGELHILRGEQFAARSAFEQTLLQTTDTLAGRGAQVIARLNLVMAFLGDQDIAGARGHLAELKSQMPEHPYTHLAESAIAMAERDWELATIASRKALQMLPDDSQALTLAGGIAVSAANYGQAEMYLNRALAVDPANQKAKSLLARAKLKRADPDEAARILTEFSAANRDDPQSRLWLSFARFDQGQIDLGIESLLEAIELDPNNSDLAIAAIQLMISNGRPDKARDLMQDVGANLLEDYQETLIEVATLQAEGSQAKAVEVLQSRMASAADDFRLHMVAGAFFVSIGDDERGRSSFVRAAELDKTSPDPLIRLAALALGHRELDTAANYLERAEAVDGENEDVALARAELTLRREDTNAAAEYLERISVDQPDWLKVAIARVALLRSTGQNAPAIMTLQKLRERYPDNARFAQDLAQLLLAEGRFDEAVSVARQGLTLRPSSHVSALTLAEALFHADGEKEAERLVTRVVSEHPTILNARLLALQFASARGAQSEAQRMAEAAVKDFPNRVEPVIALARIAFAAERPADAEAILEAAMQDRDDPRIVIELFNLQAAAGRRNAESVLNRWLADNPEDTSVRQRRAAYRMDSGAVEAAIADYREIVARNPTDVVALNNLAWLMRESNPVAAVEFARQAAVLAPDSFHILDTYGWLLAGQGEYEQAANYLRAALDLAGELAAQDIRYHLAYVLEKTGNDSDALALLNELESTQLSQRYEQSVRQLRQTLESKSQENIG